MDGVVGEAYNRALEPAVKEVDQYPWECEGSSWRVNMEKNKVMLLRSWGEW